MTDFREIDWNEAWKERLARRTLFVHDADSWGKRAPSFAEGAAKKVYAEAFVEIIKPREDWTVFDMGCGAGTLAIPLARKVKAVTAVDFSETMLQVLREQARELGLSNIRTINGSWEDDWTSLGIGLHDIVIASRSLIVEDLRAAVIELNRVAGKAVYISTIVDDGPCDRRVFDAVGRDLDMGPDYIYNYNLLYQMGIHAKVDFIIERERKSYTDHEDAYQSLKWMVGNITREEEDKLKNYVGKHLVPGGDAWVLDYERIVKWAILWWEKKPEDEAANVDPGAVTQTYKR